MQNLTHIISRCKDQDRFAQKQLYSYTYTKLAAAVALYSKDISERDWIFNLGMMKVFTSLDMYLEDTNYLGWARTLLVRAAVDHYRSNKKYRDKLTALELTDHNISSQDFEQMMNVLDTESIMLVIQKLPEKERLVFSMHELDGYAHEEIQNLTGINMNTSKWILAKSKNTLKNFIENSVGLKKHGYAQ